MLGKFIREYGAAMGVFPCSDAGCDLSAVSIHDLSIKERVKTRQTHALQGPEYADASHAPAGQI